MRILVVGTMPPPGGEGSRSLAAIAARLVEEGNDVEVLSPDVRSAAHRHARLTGVLLAANLAYLASRFDALVLRLEPDLPLRNDTRRLSRAVTLFTLGCALRLWKDITLRIDSPLPLPGGVGGRPTRLLWSRVSSVVVQNEDDAAVVREAPGLDESRLIVEGATTKEVAPRREDWVFAEEGDLRMQFAQVVRERARRDRLVNSARVELGEHEIGPLATSAFASQPDAPNVATILRFALGHAQRVARETRSRSAH